MEGPYRDLGAGFARLVGPEGARRSPSRIASVEDALFELLRNSRDAGARNIYVASTLRNRRYRTLTVLDDGTGIPETHRHLVFEPGVTTRHLNPTFQSNDATPHGAGLSLYHIKNAALNAEVASNGDPTSITTTFDTRSLPERSLQSGSRVSRTNLSATLRKFHQDNPNISLYHSSPARILATLQKNRIIPTTAVNEKVRDMASEIGLEVSLRTVQRMAKGKQGPVEPLSTSLSRVRGGGGSTGRGGEASVFLGGDETDEIEAILKWIVRARYLEMGDLRVESRPGEISFKVQIYEPEDEYE